MRLLLDTNVFVAAFLSFGACHELVEHCALKHDLVVSEAMLEELPDLTVVRPSGKWMSWGVARARNATGVPYSPV